MRDDRFVRLAGFPDRRIEGGPSQQREVVRVGEALDSYRLDISPHDSLDPPSDVVIVVEGPIRDALGLLAARWDSSQKGNSSESPH